MNQEFISIITEHHHLIYKVCSMYRDNSEDMHDLYQDIVLQLWRAFPSFRGESKISTWIYRIALNTNITQLRKAQRNPIHSSITEQMTETIRDTQFAIDEIDHLNKAIAQLTEIEKAIIILYMDEYKYKEIADIIGTTESNVGFKINQIKKKLKEIITR